MAIHIHPVLLGSLYIGAGDTDFLVSDVLPLLKEYMVDAYFCGHDHDLELLSEHTPQQPLPKNVTELTVGQTPYSLACLACM